LHFSTEVLLVVLRADRMANRLVLIAIDGSDHSEKAFQCTCRSSLVRLLHAMIKPQRNTCKDTCTNNRLKVFSRRRRRYCALTLL